MNKKISRIIALILVVIAFVFLLYVLNHPEASFSWNNSVTYTLYGLYVIAIAVLLAAPWDKK